MVCFLKSILTIVNKNDDIFYRNGAYRDPWRDKTAVYGNDALYKVHAVMAMSAPRRTSSQDENHHTKDEYEGRRNTKGFQEILEEECSTKSKQIEVITNGYTKNAAPFFTVIRMRDYTNQQ